MHALTVGLSRYEPRKKSHHCIHAAPYPAIRLWSLSPPSFVFPVPLSLRGEDTRFFIPRFLEKVLEAFIRF